MLKNYELMYILHPDLEGSSDKINEKVAGFIKKAEGEITNQEDWGKRKLAYRIAKNDFGVYVLVNFTMPSEKLPEIERDLRLSEEVIRFIVVTLPEVRKERKVRTRDKKDVKKPEIEEVKTTKTVETKETPVVEEKIEKKEKETVAKKTTEKKKAPTKAAIEKAEKATKKEEAATEKERMKKLDEKLEEILGE